jgi:hypothetical protein
VHDPPLVRFTVPYALASVLHVPDQPVDAAAEAKAFAYCKEYSPPGQCEFLHGGVQGDAFAMGQFSLPPENPLPSYHLLPGSGKIQFSLDVQWHVPSTGFATCEVEMAELINIPVMWVTST